VLVGEKAFATDICAQNKAQIAATKAAAVIERCDWCSLMVVKQRVKVEKS
jgi:hypothetical protein